MISDGNATVIVSNMDASIRFYTEVLGLKLTKRFGDDWATVRAGEGLVIGLHPASPNYPTPGTRGSILLGLDLHTSIERAVARLAEHGVATEGAITRSEAGNFVSLGDPDGNAIYLWEKTPLIPHSQELAHRYRVAQSSLGWRRDTFGMHLTPDDRLVVLTGAGISAESGLATFRGSGGLWNGHRTEDVATPEAWAADPALVWNFYSNRRHEARAAEPNAAHLALVALEQQVGDGFYLVTQNVDDLHERAGSRRIHHMHGTLSASRCVACDRPFPDQALYLDPARLPTCTVCGAAIRPHIVWFGEIPLDLDTIFAQLDRASVLLVIGTSGAVYPAAAFVRLARQGGARTLYVGPEEPLNAVAFDEILLGPATEVVPKLFR